MHLLHLLSAFCLVEISASCSSFSGWDAYISSWNNVYFLLSERLFPFGSSYCDRNVTELERASGFNPQITFSLPFYGSVYRSLWVSPDGFIALDQRQAPTFVTYMFKQSWPNPLYPESADPPFIGVFYAKANFRLGFGSEPSKLMYRVLDPAKAATDSERDIQEGMLNHLSSLVKDAIVGADFFIAKYGIVVTWYEVSFDSGTCSTDTCNRNTYQVAIVTDGLSTYTINNYFDVTWIGGAGSQSCDQFTGLPSSEAPNCSPAHVGFNAGHGRGFTALPYSNENQVSELDTRSGSDVRGRWFYDIGGNVVRHGGCTDDSNLGSSGRWPLVFDPLGGPMFGGNVITFSGPCFASGQDIKCRFQDIDTPGVYTGNKMKAICVAPMQYRIGYVDLAVSVNGGNNFYFQSKYLNEVQERMVWEGSEVTVVNVNNDWLNPSRLRLTWRYQNLTSNEQDRLSITLMGYREDNTEGIWEDLYTFQDNYNNQGLYEFTPGDNLCSKQNEPSTCLAFEYGAFRISVNEWQWNPNHPRSIWSGVIPLAWFTKGTLTSQLGVDWPTLQCGEWHIQDSQTPAWRSSLPHCPCILSQAYVDFGRFQPDLGCNLKNSGNEEHCVTHPGAKACFQALFVSPSGSSITCCYDQFDNLMYAGDSVGGSISHRSSPSGRYPYVKAPLIPSLSHWMHDLMPYYKCCMWQTDMYDCFTRFMPARPTQDCKHYKSPAHAAAFGDPHFITFDDTKYTFNGNGEFYLLLAEGASVSGEDVNFKMQGRMMQPEKMNWGTVEATYMTAIGMQLNSGPKVTVEVNSWSRQEHLSIKVDDRLLNFSMPYLYWQDFENFIITINDDLDSITYSNFTISYRIGVGIQVAWVEGLLNVLVSITPEFHDTTRGLFGVYNGDPEDDLTPRQGGSPISPADTETIHKSFGITWAIQESETLFTHLYRSRKNYNWYRNLDYVPVYSPTYPPNNSVSEPDVNALCGTRTSCRFDYIVTQSRTIAEHSNGIAKWDAHMRLMSERVLTCGWLEIPSSIKEEPVSYLVGSQVSITGCRFGFRLQGTRKTYTCMESSSDPDTAYWSPSPGVECVYTGGGLTDLMIAAISVPSIIVGILIIIAIIVLCLWCRKRRKKKEMEKKKMASDQEEFQDLDVIGYGKNTNMFYNPNNPAVTGIGQPVRHEQPPPSVDSSTLKHPPPSTSSNSTPKKVMPPPSTIKTTSSESGDFFDKDSVDGTLVKGQMDTVLLPSTLEKKKKDKKKKKKEPVVAPPPQQPQMQVAQQPPPQVQPPQRTRDGRPRRPEMKPYAPAAPPSEVSMTPPPSVVQAPYVYDPHVQYSDNSSVGLHSGVSQQDLEHMYRQQEAETQWLNEQNRPRNTGKPRPYRYPTAERTVHRR